MNEEVCSETKAGPECETTYEQECSTNMVMEMRTVQEQECKSVPEQVYYTEKLLSTKCNPDNFRCAKL